MNKDEVYNELLNVESLAEGLSIFLSNFDILDDEILMFSDATNGMSFPSAIKEDSKGKAAILNLFTYGKYAVVNKNVIHQFLRGNKNTDFIIDACVCLDTNAMSYLIQYFNKGNCEYETLVKFLLNKYVTYDCSLYIFENYMKTSNKIDMYNNFLAYEKLRNIDVPLYESTGEIRCSVDDLVLKIGADALLSDSLNIPKEFEEYLKIWNNTYALLLKAIAIEFSNSKKSWENKMKLLLGFCQKELGSLVERELTIILYFFKREMNVQKFFKKMQNNNNKTIIKDINGMTWDLFHIRMLEVKHDKKSTYYGYDFSLYSIVSYDNGLKEVMDAFSYNSILLADRFYGRAKVNWTDYIVNSMEDYYSDHSRLERGEVRKNLQISVLITKLEIELINTLTF